MSNAMQEFETIDHASLDNVTGGGFWGSAARLVGRAGGKLLGWPLTAAEAAYDGYQGYSEARAKGKTVTESVGAGVQNAASGATLGIIPPPK